MLDTVAWIRLSRVRGARARHSSSQATNLCSKVPCKSGCCRKYGVTGGCRGSAMVTVDSSLSEEEGSEGAGLSGGRRRGKSVQGSGKVWCCGGAAVAEVAGTAGGVKEWCTLRGVCSVVS